MNRRVFLKSAVCTGAVVATGHAADAKPRPFAVIDTHIHLFDTARPGGVPWPEKSDTAIFKPSLPQRLRDVTGGLGVVGAIAIEASPLASDNAWVLSVAEKDPMIVGYVGNLIPGSSDYLASLDVLRRSPLFLGIRYGNLWGRDLASDLVKPGFIEGLKALADAGLVLDTANPDPRLIHAVLRIAEQVPHLTIIVDHLPHGVVPSGPVEKAAYLSDLRALGRSPRVFIKLSEIISDASSETLNRFAVMAGLDSLWEIFGEDKVLYGSDWPNSEHFATYARVFGTAKTYVESKGPVAAQKFFYKNSVLAYRWKPRSSEQGHPDVV